MILKETKINLKGQAGQSVIEYVLLAAIAVIALVVGSNFVANVKGNAFEKHFQSAQYRLNNPGKAIGTSEDAKTNTDDSANDSCPAGTQRVCTPVLTGMRGMTMDWEQKCECR